MKIKVYEERDVIMQNTEKITVDNTCDQIAVSDQFETIANAVMSKFGLSWDDENTSEPAERRYHRDLIMYFCREHTDLELTMIASKLGNETYRTVAESVHSIKERAEYDYVFEELLKDFAKRVVQALKKAC